MTFNQLISAGCALCAFSLAQASDSSIKSYQEEKSFLSQHKIDTLELSSPDGKGRILVAPDYQARVMTSTATGITGHSFGWINHRLIASGEVSKQFNPIGGEERFWLGPEGGPFSLYFKKGEQQVFENWAVPPIIDTLPFTLLSQTASQLVFGAKTTLINASGTELSMDIKRSISLMDRKALTEKLDLTIADSLQLVAYETDNVITNTGEKQWTKESGLVSIWMLGMFNPTETTTVFIPYKEDAKGVIVNDEYFGKIPADRLIAKDGMLYFKIDGKHRSKLGVPKGRATHWSGSYDSASKVLTLVWSDVDKGDNDYLNGQWGEQENPYAGDVINAYNDGPVDDGSIMGPFYEIETSSPGKELGKGESLRHRSRTIHIQGDEEALSLITKKLFNVTVQDISKVFQAQ